MDPTTIATLSLILTTVMGVFTIFTYRQKAGTDQLTSLRAEVQELKFKLAVAEGERTRLQIENYRLMQDAFGKRP